VKEMLSRVELEYIRNPEVFHPEYSRVLRLRIRQKLDKLKGLLQLLVQSEFAPYLNNIIANCCGVTENCNALQNSVTLHQQQKSPFQAAFQKSTWCRGVGFEPSN